MPVGVGHRPASHYGHEGFKWKDELPPDYTAEELRSYLPGRKVGTAFIEWYRQDVHNRGTTVPFMKYSGPGNATNIGEPVNEADKFAKIHDLEYSFAKFRHNKGHITNEQLKKETDAADIKFMKSNGWNITASMDPREQLASIIGGLGIGIKYGAEATAGQIYPSLEKSTDPDIPTTSTNLADSLMKNLNTNVSLKRTSDESASMSRNAGKTRRIDSGDRIATGASGGEASLPHKVPVQSQLAVPDIEMPQLTGTGKEQASGGASSDGMTIHTIDRPISIFGTKTSTYKKVHKFMTFGFAPNGILENVNTQDIFLSSYLAEIPWHIPALYLNQSEFDLLPESSRVKKLSIEVVYRGSTIQFETAASTTGLATLNQINDIGVAYALNRTGWGSNARYTAFSDTQPMIPTGVAQPLYGPIAGTYRGMIRDYYGSNNNTTTFQGDIPKHQLGRQTFLKNYWVMSTRGNVVPGANSQFGGWPCLAEKFTQMDGKTVVNQVVASSTYEPKMAPIKSPLRTVGHGLPFPAQNGTISAPGLGNMVNQRQANITVTNVVPSTSGVQASTTEVSYSLGNAATVEPTFSIYTPIEKSQYASSGYWNTPEGHIQPSIHIGVQPVPALSSAALLIEDNQFNQWTDTRAYWEVTAEMIVEEHTPTAYPYAAVANVPLGENVLWAPTGNRPVALTNPNLDGATICGLYSLSSAPLTG